MANKYKEYFMKKHFAPIILNRKKKNPVTKWQNINDIVTALLIAFGDKNIRAKYDGSKYDLGVLTGKISNITVLDFDVKNNNYGESYNKLEELDSDNVLINTFKVFTGKYNNVRGFHLYFKYVEGLRQTTNILPGLDIRNDGGYVKIIGSHDSGVNYEIVNDNAEILELNQNIIDFLLKEQNKKNNSNTTNDKDEINLQVNYCKYNKNTVIDPNVVNLVEKLSIERSDNYDSWVKLGMLLKGLGEQYKDLWHSFSSKSDKYDEKACDKFWNSFNDESKFTIASLIYWAKIDTGEEINTNDSFRDIDVLTPIDPTNPDFDFREVAKMYKDEDITDQMPCFIKHLAQVINFLINRVKYIVKTIDEKGNVILKYYSENEIRIMSNGYKYLYSGKKISLWKIIADNKSNLTFNDTFFMPTNTITPNEGYINTFTGIKASLLKDIDYNTVVEKCRILLEHIANIWADNDQNSYNYIIGWLKNKIVKLQKNQTALLIISEEQGVGKTCIGHWLCEKVIGSEYCSETDNIESIATKFNSIIDEKILTVVNELSKYSNKKCKDKLKNIVTDKSRNIERKGIDIKKKEDFNSYIMFSNHFDCIHLDPSDRRYAVFKCGKKQDKKYYDELLKALEDKELPNYFYTFLYYYDDIDERDIPKTEIRETLLQNSDHILEFVKTLGKKLSSIQLPEFYKDYLDYCEKNNLYDEPIGFFKLYFMGYFKQNNYIDIKKFLEAKK